MENPIQGYGSLKVKLTKIEGFNLEKSLVMKKFCCKEIIESEEVQRLSFRISFYHTSIDRISSPNNFSQQVQVLLSPGDEQVNLFNLSLSWPDDKLPMLQMAMNTIELAKQNRLIMLIWASGHPWLQQETLVG